MKPNAGILMTGTFLSSIVFFSCSQSNNANQKTSLENSSKPNIIYIMADDLGYGHLACYGQKLIQTPNIDRLAKEGMKFTQAYSGCYICAPARST